MSTCDSINALGGLPLPRPRLLGPLPRALPLPSIKNKIGVRTTFLHIHTVSKQTYVNSCLQDICFQLAVSTLEYSLYNLG
jgi:hypothetical protein